MSIDKDVVFASKDTFLLKRDSVGGHDRHGKTSSDLTTRGHDTAPPVGRDTSQAHREAQASLGHQDTVQDGEKVPNITDIIDEINGYAQTASHTLSELFGKCFSQELTFIRVAPTSVLIYSNTFFSLSK